ncbi:MAG: glutamine amidotransferase [Oscillospiraceae bacterium]|nr:glutamine amidotransferase [Oscillospiraceae bacterium]
MKKILFAGESWVTYTAHTKGFDTFYTSSYGEGATRLIKILSDGGYDVTYLNNEVAAEKFPYTKEELAGYDAVILSDIGSNTLLLSAGTFVRSEFLPDRCESLRDYVKDGGALCMIGGYLSFSGIDAKARYGQTALAEALPVEMLEIDDRCEVPQGVTPKVVKKDHAILKGVGDDWPRFLGYNRTILKKSSDSIATIGGDPFIAIARFGKGRTAIFSSDCSPHWGSNEFMEWKSYDGFWTNFAGWLCGD